MKLKHRRAKQKPKIKLKRRQSKQRNTYCYHHQVNPVCLECGERSGDYYTIESRVILCSDYFYEYFKIMKEDFFVEEKVKGIAERFHKLWLKRFKEGGGVFSDWNQTLMKVNRRG